MFEVYALLCICTILASVCSNGIIKKKANSVGIEENVGGNTLALLLLIFLMVWFSGTRTRMNDTVNYISSYREIEPSINALNAVSWSLGDNPLFSIFEILLKRFVSNDPQILIFSTSAIIVTSMVMFLYRYSWKFEQSLYLFIAFTVFGFTMAAIKQSMATAIAIWALPNYANRKYGKAIFLTILAVLIHPYVIVLSIAIALFHKGVWNRAVYIILGMTVIIGLAFSSFTSLMFRLTSLIGQDYEESWSFASSGVRLTRVLAYAITPVLSFFYRDKLRQYSNPFYDMCVNMSIVSLSFSIISSFGGAVFFGRIPQYFDVITCIALPYVLSIASIEEINKQDSDSSLIKAKPSGQVSVLTIVILGLYLYYYTTYYQKYFVGYNVGFWDSVYNHASLFSILFGG